MTEEEYRTLMADRNLNDRFKEVLEFLWRTGARPGEIAAIQARHLYGCQPIVRLQPTEHKTGTKTGRQREIIMPPDLRERPRRYAQERPRGPLLRNTRGNPWTQDLISEEFGRTKRRLGLSPDLVIYMTRHALAMRLIKPGSDIALVARPLIHSNAEVLQTYYHPDTEAMVNMVAEEDKGEAEKLVGIREKVREDRRKRRSPLKTDNPSDG
jgi:integrase